ncbi:MAG TPA: STAS/SEC14 domain-containing protein [Gemmatimonadaceae bacterium]|nr:STAS/SEC14 domain-containing protein [Gemmatimonadaceae bacterium]
MTAPVSGRRLVRPAGVAHPRLEVLTHAGKEVILFNLRGMTDHEAAVALVEGVYRQFMDAQVPDKQGLTLVDVRDTPNSPKAATAMRNFAQLNIPYVKASAVVTNSSINRLAVSTIAMFTKRKIKTFEDPTAAMEWLVAQ